MTSDHAGKTVDMSMKTWTSSVQVMHQVDGPCESNAQILFDGREDDIMEINGIWMGKEHPYIYRATDGEQSSDTGMKQWGITGVHTNELSEIMKAVDICEDLHWYQADTHGIRWAAPLIDRRVDLMVTHRLLEGLAEAGNTLARVLFEVSKVCWHMRLQMYLKADSKEHLLQMVLLQWDQFAQSYKEQVMGKHVDFGFHLDEHQDDKNLRYVQ